MMSFRGKIIWITGASRGIGHAIALRLAAEGARIVLVAKTVEPHPRLPGTIFTAAREMEEAGGEALPLQVDIRFEDQVNQAVEKTLEVFGGIDVLVNNASAIQLTGTLQTDLKRFDLMHQVDARGTFLCSRACLPHLLRAENPHVLTLSPPLNLDPGGFSSHVAYTMAKYGMSMCTLGMAAEFKGKVAFNSLWPATTIATAAVQNLLGGDDMIRRSRRPEIVADAARIILGRDHQVATGQFYIDEEVLRQEGIQDFKSYQVDPALNPNQLQRDLFL
ncbi:MAG TPA: NAD(P)-dependent oxidoreductase [Chitinophagaceae bacterium]|nr:NAD(P)-dependent oxidoreductase [Chitinophagaceae bacterium]